MILSTDMPTPQLREAYREAVETSNWHFDDSNWTLAEWWHLRAVELMEALATRESA